MICNFNVGKSEYMDSERIQILSSSCIIFEIFCMTLPVDLYDESETRRIKIYYIFSNRLLTVKLVSDFFSSQ